MLPTQGALPFSDHAVLHDMLINKTVGIALEKGIIKSGTIIVDATHTASRSNPYGPVDVLKQRSKLLRKTIYAIDEEQKDNLPKKNEDDDLSHEMAYTESIELVAKLNPCISQGFRKEEDRFDYNKDAGGCCNKDGAKSKSYSVSIKSDEHKAQMEFQESERFKIEAKNAELKNVLGYGRALSYGHAPHFHLSLHPPEAGGPHLPLARHSSFPSRGGVTNR